MPLVNQALSSLTSIVEKNLNYLEKNDAIWIVYDLSLEEAAKCKDKEEVEEVLSEG